MLGIISATRVPLMQPISCRYAAKARDSTSRSPKVIDLPMHVKAGRPANFATDSSNTSRTEAYLSISISAGTPGGYCFSQILSTVILLRPALSRRAASAALPGLRAAGVDCPPRMLHPPQAPASRADATPCSCA